MFASLSRSLLRSAPALAVAGGTTFAAAQQLKQPVQCDQGYPVEIGQQFLQLYFAESTGQGKINLHRNMNFDQVKTMLLASGAKVKKCKEMFDLMDTDNSGTIDFCEIMVFFLEHGQGSLQQKGALFFAACDIDGNGSVEPNELKDIIHHMMLLKREEEGDAMFTAGQGRIYAGIPATYILHYQANELVNDIFTSAGTRETSEAITEKQFQTWLKRGGKYVKRMTALFGF